MAKLPDLCKIQYGYAFDSACFTENNRFLPLVRIRDVKRGYSETFYSGNYPEEYIIDNGSLLIGMDGEFNIARWKGGKALLNQRVCKISAKDTVNEEYIRFALSKALKEIEARTAFVTVKHLSAKELNRLEINIPDYETQTDISAILTKIELVVTIRQQQLQKLDELVKARFVEMFGDPITNTKGWKIEKAEKHIDLLSGFPFDSSRYTQYGVKICGGLIIMPQRIDWDSCKYWSSIEGFEEYTLQEKDIVMALDRPWISDGFKIAMVDADELPALLIQRTVRIRAVDINQYYLMYCFVLGGFEGHCNVTGSLVPHISAKDIRSFPIMLPPIQLQNQFAAFVEQIDKSKAAIQKALDEAQLLFDSLMQKCFG